jgi:SNF2 family DNA or RNA helicase
LHRFQRDAACRFLLLNNQSGALGLNLQVANYVIFYERPVSPIVSQQAEARCLRTGQQRTVFFYDLVAKGTVDEKIARYLEEGKDLFNAIVAGKETL